MQTEHADAIVCEHGTQLFIPATVLIIHEFMRFLRDQIAFLQKREPVGPRLRVTIFNLLHKAGDGVRLSEHLEGYGALMFRRACAMGLEGIVSKRVGSVIQSEWVNE